MSMSGKHYFFLLSFAFLITGNLVGAGILALPINTGLSGFFPSLVIMLVMASAMYYSAVILGREAANEKSPSFNYPSLYHSYLGFFGKWLAILANLLILYGLLTAYLTGATSIITHLFNLPLPEWAVLLCFFLMITAFNLTESKTIRKYNILLIVVMWISFAVIVILSETKVEIQRLAYTDWNFAIAAVPIILTSFHFHNIIPHVCHGLDWDMKKIWRAMLIGIVIGYAMNSIWIQVGVGSLPLEGSDASLLAAFEQGLPATVPMSKIISSPLFVTGSLLFALLAIITSYLANGLGLMGFYDDLTKNHLGLDNRFLVYVLTFGPPLFISMLYPDIFLKAVNVVGGIGIAILFGILPCSLGIRKAKSKAAKVLGYAFLMVFSTVLIFEICQEAGLLRIHPEVEYWHDNVGASHLKGRGVKNP